MTEDYSAPLLHLKECVKGYADAMRDRRQGIAEEYAVRIVRIGVDLIDHAEAIGAPKRVPTDRQLVG